MLRNYKNSRSAWGYVTLCEKCVSKLQERKSKYLDLSNPIEDMPIGTHCDECLSFPPKKLKVKTPEPCTLCESKTHCTEYHQYCDRKGVPV